jgi:hypothetical protein
MLERAKRSLTHLKGVSLFVKVWNPSFEQSDAPDPEMAIEVSRHMKAHSSRVQTLDITVSDELGTAAFIREIPFLRVEHLTLGIGIEGTTRSPSLTDVFPLGLPQLWTLDLRFFTSWRPGLFANLTKLSLRSDAEESRLLPSAMFFELLELSPLLVDITLSDYGPLDDSNGSFPQRLIPLLHLQKFWMWEVDARLILSCIKLPPYVKVEIHNQISFDQGRQPENDEFGTFFTTIPQDLSQIGLAVFKSMSLIMFTTTVQLEIYTAGGRLNVEEWYTPAPGIAEHSTPMNSLLQSLRGHHVFPTVKTFRIGYGYAVIIYPPVTLTTVDQWRGTLERFPNLENLTVYECVDENLLTVLEASLSHLVSLEVVIQEFGSSEDGVRVLEAYIKMIHARKDAGIPLRSLEIHLHLWGEATARDMATIPVLEFPGIYSDYLFT